MRSKGEKKMLAEEEAGGIAVEVEQKPECRKMTYAGKIGVEVEVESGVATEDEAEVVSLHERRNTCNKF